ncbi:enoyl-CoA hydratase [Acidiferrimicrobium sp. IK]|uniref:enoyl-CoA hydratase n=1 Tax=Acidiferrimicrobium sp. IK TaxID=2871700 RepID=UPI0021CB6A7D|nr:enoyl-CoA hydratase [Acidiferrimicrobium sp. IK]MCU4185434.1 enoyl-CoA hydratase [Acidiferrimicrobium sp. IK]
MTTHETPLSPSVLLTTISAGVATVVLNRPAARNALNRELIDALATTMVELDADPLVRVIVLTGADPAFCAGLDLRDLGRGEGALLEGGTRGGFWPTIATPVIGAINGAAVTGGLEVALQCDIRIASQRARFADTHARVGVMPGAGLTVRLPAAVGLARALDMSLTGRFVTGDQAAAWGLVSAVVPHDQLLSTAAAMAAAVGELDPLAATTLLGVYRAGAAMTGADATANELEAARAWKARSFDAATVAARRDEIIARGSRLS